MKELEIIIFGFVSVIGSLLLLVLAFNCLQAIYDNLRSRSIVKKITGKLRGILGNWRPGNRSTRSVVVRLQSLSFLRFKGRATSEQEQFGRAAFQFEVIGTPWIAIVLDNTFGRQAQTIFIDSSTSSEQRRYVWYGNFLQQIPRELRQQFVQHRELFHRALPDKESFHNETPISWPSPFRAKLQHWLGRIVAFRAKLKRWLGRGLGWLFTVYAVVAGLYLVYGLIYEKGIVGYLIYYLGEDEGGGDSVSGGGGAAIVLYMFSLLGYFFLEDFINDDQRNSTIPSITQEPPVDEPWRPISWKTFLSANVSILIVTMLIFGPYVWTDFVDQQRPVYQADLTRSEFPEEDAKFATLRGVLRSDHEFHWVKENGSTNEVWTPLVGSEWRPEQPVKYIHYRRWESVATNSNPIPVWHGPQDPTMRSKWLKRQGKSDESPGSTYTVQLSINALPTWVEMKLRDKGIKLASPYYLAEKVELDADGKVISNPYGILIIGTIVAVGLMLIANVIMVRKNMYRRRTLAQRTMQRISVTAAQIANQAVIHIPTRNGEAVHIKLPRDAKQGDVFCPGGWEGTHWDNPSDNNFLVYLDVVG